MSTSIMWFRRDLRLSDNPALLAAVGDADQVVAVFVLDDNLREVAGDARLSFLYGCLQELDEKTNANLTVRTGDPVEVIAQLADEVQAANVFCTEDFAPYGRHRDDLVEAALEKDGRALRRVDSPYAVTPGSIVKSDGTPFKVFTPFFRAWSSYGWPQPQRAPSKVNWLKASGESAPTPTAGGLDVPQLPTAGEEAGKRRLDSFVERRLNDYAVNRDFPASGGTSRLSPYLKYGCLHPRQLLARLGAGRGPGVFRTELCWRDFYADVLFHNPQSLTTSLVEKMSKIEVDSGSETNEMFDLWSKGQTGYPIVDAGMRQLLGEAWMHNRLRMIVASFLVKDLHLDWARGAKWFMDHLVDGDVASNTHGWQWVAGTGTDAAPYFRIFNPVAQGKKFDPQGEFIRKWVPELAHLDTKYVHEPWLFDGQLDYAAPIVDHKEERNEALRRYQALKSS